MTNTPVSDQLQNLWRTRPLRLPDKGPAAGVCAGVGYRYRVDPVLVRVAFVVSTLFGGSGLVLYLAAWLTFPRVGDSASAAEALVGRGKSSESQTTMVVLAVALVIALITIGPIGVGLGGSGAISLAAVLAGWWLLHQRTPVPPFTVPAAPVSSAAPAPNAYSTWNAYSTLPDQYVPAPASPPASVHPVDLNKETDTTSPPGPPAPPGPPQPPGWDPLGVAPFAWDLPEPATTVLPATITRTRSRLTSSVLGLAIIATAVTAGIAVATGSEWFTVSRVAAVGLAVVAAGLIFGAFTRRGYGLLVLAAPLAGFVALTAGVHPADFSGAEVGTRSFAPTTVAQLDPVYSTSVGEVQLDLRGLDLTEDRSVTIDAGVGSVEVYLPDEMNVTSTCSGNVGSISCLGEGGVDGGTDGTDGPVLSLDITNNIGSVEVTRG